MVYDYLITLFNLVVGLVTKQRLLYAFLIAFGVYLLWVIFALCFCFQRKFYTKSVKLYNKLRKSDNLTDKQNLVDKYSTKFSLGFEHGWKKFKASSSGKPSMFLSRNEVLDIEFSGGILNQGKSFMKSYIWITTILLLLFNLAFHGGSEVMTFTLFAESMVLPIIYLILLRIFYYLYTSVKQQIYKLDIEVYYELIDLLDLTFNKDDNNVQLNNKVVNNFADKSEDSNINNNELSNYNNISEESVERKPEVDKNVSLNESTLVNEPQEDHNEKETKDLENLDTFENNNNIDNSADEVDNEVNNIVESFENNSTNNENAINLEKYAVDEKTQRQIFEEESGYNEFKEDDKEDSNEFENNFDSKLDDDLDQTQSEIENTSTNDLNNDELENNIDNTKTIDAESELEKFDIFKKKNIDVKSLSNEVPSSVQGLPFINVDSDYVIKDDEDGFKKRVTPNDNASTVLGVMQDMSSVKKAQTVDENKPTTENKFFEVNKNNDSSADNSDESEGGDPQGGKVITTNEKSLENKNIESEDEILNKVSQEGLDKKDDKVTSENNTTEISKLESKESKTEDIFDKDKVKNIVGGFKTSKNKLSNGGVMIEKNTPITRRNKNNNQNKNVFTELVDGNNQLPEFSQSDYNATGFNQGFGIGGQVPQYGFTNQPVGFGPVYSYNQPQNYNGYYNSNISGFGGMPGAYDFSEQPKSNKSRKKVQTEVSKTNEPINNVTPKSSKPKAAIKQESPKIKDIKEEPLTKDTSSSKKRGRPKKQVFDEEVTINSDKEFNEVLARAEKLMRKSEEGLSASQSKRIEKELKMLMDAMNLYKERK